MDFRDGFRALQRECFETANAKGWVNDTSTVVQQLCLVHSEISEALEEFRLGTDLVEIRKADCELTPGWSKPEGFATELADAVVRICALAEGCKIDLAEALRVKMDYNKQRPFRHGGKKL